jgi:hypothetical protein
MLQNNIKFVKFKPLAKRRNNYVALFSWSFSIVVAVNRFSGGE